MKIILKKVIVIYVICMVFCIFTKRLAFASELISVSEDTYNQMILEQMEQVMKQLDEEEVELVKVKPMGGMMCITEKVNVRCGPDTSYESLGMIERDTNIIVSGITENNWYQTSYQGKVAYVLADYLKPSEIEEGLSQEMSQKIEAVIDAVEDDVVAMNIEESMQEEVDENMLQNKKRVDKVNSNFTYIIWSFFVVSGVSLLILASIKKKGKTEGGENIELKQKFGIDGMDVISFDEEE